MSRLTDLIAETKAKNPQLGADLEREFRALSSRVSFGLNFERHRPEAVELPQRPIRRGDKARVLPQRGATKKGDQRLWQVIALHKEGDRRVADLRLLNAEQPEVTRVAIDDLVVVAEFNDTIYPGLVSTGKVERGGPDRPYHTVINGENYHALKALSWSHRGKIDAIYIDPPYNTGAKDWKYNNDYVEGDDIYRHSKWLAFMERRLRLAKELLNPLDSVLIVTIDEKEYLRLGLLLQQVFTDANIRMISTLINPKGVGVSEGFKRVDEYIFILRFGTQDVTPSRTPILASRPTDEVARGRTSKDDQPQETGDEDEADAAALIGLDWQTARRRDLQSVRRTRPGQFYPIYVSQKSGMIEAVGEPLPHDQDRHSILPRKGCVAVFPVREDGTEMNWSVTGPTFVDRWKKGFARAGRHQPGKPQPYIIQYLKSGSIADIEEGRAVITGYNPDGSVIAHYNEEGTKAPATQWNLRSHNAEHYGHKTVRALLAGRKFPFPKSLYAVEDVLRLFVARKPRALILDFFAGSGTAAHAVMRLNKQDGGQRQCISVTNNEVSAGEQADLRAKGLRPGDPEWERLGICDFITKPRIAAAITGRTPDGAPIKGAYKFTDEFPMADGFLENAEFFTLTYETPIAVSHHVAFARIAPLLWLRAGSCGERIDKVPPSGWAVVQTYGLLTEPDQATPFLKAVRKVPDLTIAYIVTDDDRRFQAIARRLPDHVEPVRLYESYLTNFAFANGSEG
ncbi:DNA methyltransferase [Gemmatimonas aurantiaca]|uniref:site-specific DNA-methyltransferase n=1 Tax=Gemmatimonas aurantiaca TaxID=173480 RepID=UPI00301DD6BB